MIVDSMSATSSRLRRPGSRLHQDIDRRRRRARARAAASAAAGRRRVEDEIAGLVRREPDRSAVDAPSARGDRAAMAGQAPRSAARGGDQGEDDAHGRSSYAERRRDKRLAAQAARASRRSSSPARRRAANRRWRSRWPRHSAAPSSMPTACKSIAICAILTARPELAADGARAASALRRARRRRARLGRALARARRSPRSRPRPTAGRLPIVVGGTGLYLRALTRRPGASSRHPRASPRTRRAALHAQLGGAAFRERLAALDPDGAARLAAGDTQRLVRAYEVVRATGLPLGAWQRAGSRDRAYRLRDDPADAAARRRSTPPATRALPRWSTRAALAEAAALAARGLDPDLPAMKAVGRARAAAAICAARSPLDAAVAAAQQATRRYAKRQMTWFRHQHATPDLTLDEQFSESLLPAHASLLMSFC